MTLLLCALVAMLDASDGGRPQALVRRPVHAETPFYTETMDTRPRMVAKVMRDEVAGIPAARAQDVILAGKALPIAGAPASDGLDRLFPANPISLRTVGRDGGEPAHAAVAMPLLLRTSCASGTIYQVIGAPALL